MAKRPRESETEEFLAPYRTPSRRVSGAENNPDDAENVLPESQRARTHMVSEAKALQVSEPIVRGSSVSKALDVSC